MIISIKQRVVVFAFLLAVPPVSIFFLNRSAFKRNILIPRHETTEIQDLEAQQDEDEDEDEDEDKYYDDYFDLSLEKERILNDETVDIGKEYLGIEKKQDKTPEEKKRYSEILSFRYFIMSIHYATTSSYSELFNASQLKYWTPILKYLSSSYKHHKIIPLAIKRCGFDYDFDVTWRKRILTTETPWCTIDNVKSFVKIDIAIDKFKDWLFPEAAAEIIRIRREKRLKLGLTPD